MKTWLFILVLGLGITSARAQIFTPESLGGAALGSIAGAIIGNQVDGQAGAGAAIGAGAGYLLGEILHANRQQRAASEAAYEYSYNPGYLYYPDYRPGFLYTRSRYRQPVYVGGAGRTPQAHVQVQDTPTPPTPTKETPSSTARIAGLQSSATYPMRAANQLFGR